ncbi:hypothetical protein [Nocardia sp. NPDC050710]|uniref:hypothetical protein n=1 Tax=Nocardia sp. NPDC050710 TaxID=3157220 RepID=UPI0033E44C6B
MSASGLGHPAVVVAEGVVHSLDAELVPVAILVRAEMAAVLLESSDKRFVVFVRCENGRWVAPGMTTGTPRRMKEQQDAETGPVPLTGMSPRWTAAAEPTDEESDFAWFAVTGQAAADAVEVSLTSSADATTVPVGENGLVFALVRTSVLSRAGEYPEVELPEIRVRTNDGRAVPMPPRP